MYKVKNKEEFNAIFRENYQKSVENYHKKVEESKRREGKPIGHSSRKVNTVELHNFVSEHVHVLDRLGGYLPLKEFHKMVKTDLGYRGAYSSFSTLVSNIISFKGRIPKESFLEPMSWENEILPESEFDKYRSFVQKVFDLHPRALTFYFEYLDRGFIFYHLNFKFKVYRSESAYYDALVNLYKNKKSLRTFELPLLFGSSGQSAWISMAVLLDTCVYDYKRVNTPSTLPLDLHHLNSLLNKMLTNLGVSVAFNGDFVTISKDDISFQFDELSRISEIITNTTSFLPEQERESFGNYLRKVLFLERYGTLVRYLQS